MRHPEFRWPPPAAIRTEFPAYAIENIENGGNIPVAKVVTALRMPFCAFCQPRRGPTRTNNHRLPQAARQC